MNWGRVLLGGLVAGLLVNTFEGLRRLLLLDERAAALAAHGLGLRDGAGTQAVFLGTGFVLGLLVVWLYASIRPRYGSGPKTALIAAAALWLTYAGSIVGWAMVGLFPPSLLLVWAGVGLVQIALASLVGAWLYEEI